MHRKCTRIRHTFRRQNSKIFWRGGSAWPHPLEYANPKNETTLYECTLAAKILAAPVLVTKAHCANNLPRVVNVIQ